MVACSAILSPEDAVQCSSNDECTRRGGSFASSVCSDGICVASSNGVGGGGGSAGSAGSAGNGPSVECTTNQQCIDARGGPFICRNNACVSLLSDDCTEVVGKVGDDNAIVFGYMSVFTGGLQFIGNNYIGANKMAHQEFLDNLPGGGIPGPNGTKRPLVMVVCDEAANPLRAATHLIDDVGVQVIHGPTFDDGILEVAPKAINSGVLLVSGNGSADAVVNLDDNGLVWLTTAPQSTLYPAFVPATLQAEARIKEKYKIDTIRVAALASGTALDQSGQDTLAQTLVFNGKPALQNGDNFGRFSYPDPSLVQNPDYTPVVKALLDFKPHIIITFGFAEISRNIIPAIENDWAEVNGTSPRPEYWAYNQDPDFITDSKKEEFIAVGLRQRIHGVSPKHAHDDLYQLYVSRYRAFNNNTRPLIFSEYNYDTFYTIVYAMMAAGPVAKEQLTGSLISQQFSKLNPSPARADIFITPNDIPKAVSTIVATDAINLEGTGSSLDFELSKGYVNIPLETWCINPDNQFASTGQVFDTATGTLSKQTYFCDQ